MDFFSGDLASNPITLGEIVNATTEIPFPSRDFNIPPGGLVNTSSGRPLGSSDSTHFINVQAAVIDAKDRLWALDTGRPVVDGDNLPAVPGGPKLVGFDIGNNATKPFQTITFPESVLSPTGYLNDIRFDLRSNVTKSGKGIAYIADSGASNQFRGSNVMFSCWRNYRRIRYHCRRSRNRQIMALP